MRNAPQLPKPAVIESPSAAIDDGYPLADPDGAGVAPPAPCSQASVKAPSAISTINCQRRIIKPPYVTDSYKQRTVCYPVDASSRSATSDLRYSTERPCRALTSSPPARSARRCWLTAVVVTPSRAANSVDDAGVSSCTSSPARRLPNNAASADGDGSGCASQSVPAPRA